MNSLPGQITVGTLILQVRRQPAPRSCLGLGLSSCGSFLWRLHFETGSVQLNAGPPTPSQAGRFRCSGQL
jgi:hypothetical protein